MEDTVLVRHKASAIRGGIGEMLLRSHCIQSHRDCEKCAFRSECIVQRMLRSDFESLPASMHTGDSVGYIIFCQDGREDFRAGDTLSFELLLFGKNIIYFSEYIHAIYALGMQGLGKYNSRFGILEIKNLYGQPILQGNDICMERYCWQTLGEYIRYRREKLEKQKSTDAYITEQSMGKNHALQVQIRFVSPLSLKYKGEFQKHIQSEAFAHGLWRRLYILSCFENLCDGGRVPEMPSGIPAVEEESIYPQSVPRYSRRKEEHMKLRGIQGTAGLREISEEWWDLLLAGEVVQIGKNTSFGFGRYRLEAVADRRKNVNE